MMFTRNLQLLCSLLLLAGATAQTNAPSRRPSSAPSRTPGTSPSSPVATPTGAAPAASPTAPKPVASPTAAKPVVKPTRAPTAGRDPNLKKCLKRMKESCSCGLFLRGINDCPAKVLDNQCEDVSRKQVSTVYRRYCNKNCREYARSFFVFNRDPVFICEPGV